ncbi:MAG TPA: hypothetical protein VKE97_12505 [Acidimicrobiia bacterium]|nr:hypothetical protein [Acidimicrobiia bacterium]
MIDTRADQATDTGARRRFRRAALIGALLAAPIFYWMVNAGQLNPFHAERFGDFYDIQAHSLLHFHWDVPAKEVAFEGFLIDGKTYLYFGPVPALLRMPFVALSDSLDGRLTQVSMLAAFAVALVFVTRLSWRIRRLVRGDAPVTRLELWSVGAYVFLVAVGSVMFFLASRAFVYHETELWGAALALAAYDAILAVLLEPSRRWIILAGLWTTAAFLTRATVGAGPLVALCIVIAVLVLRRLSPRPLGGLARWFAAPDELGSARLFGWLVAAAAVPVVLYAYVNYSRFGSFFGLPLDHQVYSRFNPARRRALADNGGSLFGVKFLPTQLLQLLRPDALRFDSLFPWIVFPRPATVLFGVTFDTRDWASSIPATMPAFTVLAAGGVVTLVRRAGAAAVRAPLLGAVAGGLATFTIAFVANRYMSDLLPAIVLAGLVGFHVLLGALQRRPSPSWSRVVAGVVVVFAVASLFVNIALAIWYQRILFPQAAWERAGFIGFQQDVDDLIPGGPRGKVETGSELPASASATAGELFIAGDCDGLYQSDSREWFAVERGNGAGHFRLRVRFPALAGGDQALLGIGSGNDQNVLQVRYLPDSRVRFVLISRVARQPLVSAPQRIEPGRAYLLDVVVDTRTGLVRVTVDGHTVLDDIVFLVHGNEATIGSSTVPGQAPFTGTILELPVRTPLCDRVRSR